MNEQPTNNQAIQEFVDSRGESLHVDQQAGVLRGVKVLGVASRNGRRYPDDVLRRALPLYEGAKVNVNHPKGDPLSPRDYQDRIGVLRDVEFRSGSGLFGVLHFNPRHTLAEQLVWDAENSPENVGLSHNVLARTTQDGDAVVVAEITKVLSVDLVADPATTRGLFEQSKRREHAHPPAAESVVDLDPLAGLTLEQLEDARPDLTQAVRAPLEHELASLRATIDRLYAREAAQERRRHVEQALTEHGLPTPADDDPAAERLVSQEFLRRLLEASDDAEVDRLVKDRADAVAEAARWRPARSFAVSREQSLGDHATDEVVADAAGFVAAITRR